MKPFAAMKFRALVKQFLTWAGLATESAASGTFTLTFNNDGTLTLPDSSASRWLNKTPDAASAALYEIRWTAAAGGLTESTALTQNVWYSLASSRSFSMDGVQGATSKVSAFTIAVRLASEGGDGVSADWQHTLMGTG